MTIAEAQAIVDRLSTELQRPALHGLRRFTALGAASGKEVMLALRVVLAAYLADPSKSSHVAKWIDSAQASEMLLGYFLEEGEFNKVASLPSNSQEQRSLALRLSMGAMQRAQDLERQAPLLGDFANFCVSANPGSVEYWQKVYGRLGITYTPTPKMTQAKSGCANAAALCVLFLVCLPIALVVWLNMVS